MERQRILLYKEAEYDHLIGNYHTILRLLKELVEGVRSCDMEPSSQIIKSLLRGEDLKNQMAERTVSKAFSTLPKTMLNAIASLYKKENEDRYKELISEKVERIRAILQHQPINISYFNFENGEVSLSPDYIKDAERLYCVYVDSPGKFQVYDAWEAFVAAKEHLDAVVKSVSKRQSTPTEEHLSLYGKDMIGVAAPGNFSIGKIRFDGSLVLNGENFGWIQ